MFGDSQLEFEVVCGVGLLLSNVHVKTFYGYVCFHATEIMRYVVVGES